MPEGVRSVNVDALGVHFTSLVDLIRTRAGDWGVAGILLCGSFARREVDVASDIDLIVAVEATTRSVQVGTWMGRDIEILYMSLESLAAHRPTRGTLRGAAVLYDPQDRLAPLVRQWEAHFAEPRQTPPAEREYGRWEIAHTLTVMERLAGGVLRAILLYVRNEWVSDVVGYLFDSAGDWPPTRRRQLPRLETWYPGIVADLEGLLAAHEPNDTVQRARAVTERWLPEAAIQPLEEAVIYSWPVDS